MDSLGASSPTVRPFLKWWIALAMSLGMLSVALSITAVSIAIPSIMVSLAVSLDKIQWVLTGPMITKTVLMPSVGWLGGRIGDRNVFIASMAAFTAGSLLCSIAWDATSLILFRIIQAIGAGPLVAVAMSIMFEAFPRNERGLAMGLLMTGWSIGPFFGPLLGGYLVQYVHWRAIFYINIPVGLLSIAAVTVLLPKSRGKGAKPFDLPGFATLTGGTVLLLLTLSQVREWGWGSRPVMSFFVASIILLFLFVVVELRATHPYVELRHFRSVNFTLSNIIMFFRVFGFRGSNFLFALFLQRALHYTPLQAGIFLLPGAVMTGICSPLVGIVSDRLGPRIPLIGGLVILIASLYGFSTLTLWSSAAFILFLVGLKSVGQSSLNAPLNAVALGSLPDGNVRMASGIIGMTRGLGESFGITTLSLLLERYSFFNLRSLNPLQSSRFSEPERLTILSEMRDLLVQAGEFGMTLQNKALSLLGHTLLNEAMTQAYHDLFILIAGIYGVLIVNVMLLRMGKEHSAA